MVQMSCLQQSEPQKGSSRKCLIQQPSNLFPIIKPAPYDQIRFSHRPISFTGQQHFSQVGLTAVLSLPHIILSSFDPQIFTEYPPDQVTELGTPGTRMSLLFAGF